MRLPPGLEELLPVEEDAQTPQCSLASSVLLPKIGFDPLTRAVHLTQAPYALHSELALSNS